MQAIWKRKWVWMPTLILLGLAGFAWSQRRDLLACYYVRQLTYAYQDNREGWVNRVVELDEAALPRLYDGLLSTDAIVCSNMQAALGGLGKKWGAADPRTQQMMNDLYSRFDQLSGPGQQKTLLLLAMLLRQDGSKPLAPTLARGIGETLLVAEKENALRSAALLVAAELVDCVQPGQWVDACRELAERGLHDPLIGVRIATIQLVMRAPMRKDKELLAKVIPLLHDKEASVRRVALLALASETDLVREEGLMALLLDDDAQVQYLCEQALRSRGLTDDDIRVARMISDKNPAVRMRVLQHLPTMHDPNLAEWLRQLSQDPAPAVRAAAARAAGECMAVDLSARLREMADSDPSETVRMNASFYLQHRLTMRAMNDR